MGSGAVDGGFANAAMMLVALFGLAGLAYSLLLGTELRFPDERDYLATADSLVTERMYSVTGESPDALRPPGYPLLLAPVVAGAHVVAALANGGEAAPERVHALSVHAVRTLQFVFLALSACLLATLAGRGARPGDDAAPPGALQCAMLLALAVYPVLIYTAGTLFPQTALLALGTLVLWLLERAKPTHASAALVGLLCGAAAEVSPTVLTLVPLAIAHALLNPRWSAKHALVIVLAAALLPGAWLARNLVVMDATILFSRNLAYNLDNAVLELKSIDPEQEEREPDNVFGYGAERLVQIAAAPGAYFDRFGDHFAWRNKLQVQSESSPLRDTVMLVTYSALLLLVALRLALARRVRLSSAERAAIALYVMTAAFHALVFVRIRYRLPFDFLLLLPALNALLICASPWFARRAGGANADARTTLP